MRKLWLGVAGLVVVAFIALAVWGWVPQRLTAAGCRLTKNAAWIDVDWTSKPVSESAVRGLASSAANRHIRYLFPYTTYVKSDGSFSPSYSHAAEFVSQFRRFDRDTLLLAWVGIPLKNDRPFGIEGWVDLADPATRRKIASFVGTLVTDANLDGVHLNVETVPNNDPAFLLLLDEMRNVLGRLKISVASRHWAPSLVDPFPWIRDWWWTDDYYRQVAKRTDQIVVMAYDSFLPAPALYRLWLREQTRGIDRALAPLKVELLIGISVSREETVSHHPSAENLESGLAGLCAAVSDGTRTVQGAAIYADWEFSPADQKIWDEWQK